MKNSATNRWESLFSINDTWFKYQSQSNKVVSKRIEKKMCWSLILNTSISRRWINGRVGLVIVFFVFISFFPDLKNFQTEIKTNWFLRTLKCVWKCPVWFCACTSHKICAAFYGSNEYMFNVVVEIFKWLNPLKV